LAALSTPGAQLSAVVLGLAVLASAGPERLERLPLPCLWSRVLGRPCPACGILRATSCALRGRWARAWNYNPLVVVVVPTILGIGTAAAVRLWRDRTRT